MGWQAARSLAAWRKRRKSHGIVGARGIGHVRLPPNVFWIRAQAPLFSASNAYTPGARPAPSASRTWIVQG